MESKLEANDGRIFFNLSRDPQSKLIYLVGRENDTTRTTTHWARSTSDLIEILVDQYPGRAVIQTDYEDNRIPLTESEMIFLGEYASTRS